MARSTTLQVKNNTGSVLPANKLVYVTGKDATDGVPTVAIASNISESKMPAIGMVREEIANGELGEVRVAGLVSGFDTKGKTPNAPIYAGKDGNITFTLPTTGTAQRIGLIVDAAAEPDGQLFLFPLDITVKHAESHERGGNDEIDHDELKGLNIDSHKIYSLVDGSRAFTGAVEGVTPTQPSHLVTKQYVDGLGQVVSTTIGSAADGYVAFFLNDRTVAGDNDFFWDRANNRLGIGTSSPSQKLTIHSDEDPSIVISENGSTTSFTRILDSNASVMIIEKVTEAGTNSIVRLNPMPASPNDADVQIFRNTDTSGDRDFSIFRGNGGTTIDHRLSTSTRNSYLVNGGGNLGVGTASPTSFRLQVDGYVGPNVDNVYGLGSPALRWQSLSVGPGSIHIVSTAAETGIEQDWTLGIKTEGSAGAFHISRDGANYLTISPSGSVSMPSISNAHFITSTNTNPVQISRIGETTQQVVNIGVDDSAVQFYHIQDEAAANYKFRCHALTGPTDRTMHLDSDASSMRLGIGAQTTADYQIAMLRRDCSDLAHSTYLDIYPSGSPHGESGILLRAGSDANPWYMYRSTSAVGAGTLRWFYTGAGDAMQLSTAGNLSIGNFAPSTYRLHTRQSTSGDFVCQIENNANVAGAHVLALVGGQISGVGQTIYIGAYDSDSTQVGRIEQTAGSVFQIVDVSDERIKTDIAPSEVDAISIINTIQPIEYRFKKADDAEKLKGKRAMLHECGFSAQNIQQAFPEAISEDSNGTLGVAKSALIPVLIKAIKEQQELIEDLKSRIEILETFKE